MERRDAIEEAGSSGRGTAEFPGITESWSLFESSGIKIGYGGRTACPNNASAQTRRRAGRRQGLKILAREANKIAARGVPNSQADWLWDCTTPEMAPTGTFVSAGALRFARNANIFLHAARAVSSSALAVLKGHGFQPCRQEARRMWPFGPEGQSPQRLKPGPLVGVNGTPEGVPLQSRQTKTAIAFRATAALRVERRFSAASPPFPCMDSRPPVAAGENPKSLSLGRRPKGRLYHYAGH